MTTKEKILEAALNLIVTQGIQQTPMSQISVSSGVAMGTIYHHFKSKNDIVNAIFLNLKNDLGTAFLIQPDNELDYKLTFFQFWKIIFDFYCHNELHFKFIQTFIYSPLISEQTKEESLKNFDTVSEFFLQGIEKGILKPFDIVLLTEMIYGNIITLVQIYFQKTINVNDNIINQAIEISWNSIKI